MYRVTRDAGNRFHFIFHGTTLHGVQSLEPSSRLRSTSYYHRTGPAGQVFTNLSANGFDKPVAVVGLGAGALACYEAGRFLPLRIDPWWTHPRMQIWHVLEDCLPNIVTRRRARDPCRAPNGFPRLFYSTRSAVFDPIHLLTLKRSSSILPSSTGGVLLFHISTLYGFNEVCGAIAANFDLTRWQRLSFPKPRWARASTIELVFRTRQRIAQCFQTDRVGAAFASDQGEL